MFMNYSLLVSFALRAANDLIKIWQPNNSPHAASTAFGSNMFGCFKPQGLKFPNFYKLHWLKLTSRIKINTTHQLIRNDIYE